MIQNKKYFLKIFETYDNNFFTDYLTNPEKRLQNLVEDEKFWKDYSNVFLKSKKLGKIILRAKVVSKKKLYIYQIWEDKNSYISLTKSINEKDFFSKFDKTFSIIEKEINEVEKNKLIKKIIKYKNIILQVVREDHRIKGMIIGDPLKGNTIIKID